MESVDIFYAHENNTTGERSKLECTRDDMVKLNEKQQKMIMLIFVQKEERKKKWTLTINSSVTVFVSLLKDVPMGWSDCVSPETLLESQLVNCFTLKWNMRQPYNGDLCVLRAFFLHLNVYHMFEEKTSKNFNLFLKNIVEGEHSKVDVFGAILQPKIFLWDFTVVDIQLFCENVERKFKHNDKQVKL